MTTTEFIRRTWLAPDRRPNARLTALATLSSLLGDSCEVTVSAWRQWCRDAGLPEERFETLAIELARSGAVRLRYSSLLREMMAAVGGGQ